MYVEDIDLLNSIFSARVKVKGPTCFGFQLRPYMGGDHIRTDAPDFFG